MDGWASGRRARPAPANPPLALVLAGALLAVTVHAQNVTGPQRLTTAFRGPGLSLDVINGGPQDNQIQLSTTGNFTGQQWILQGRANGFVALTTAFRGPGMCLDVVNGGPRNNQVELRPCGNFTGQQWRLSRQPQGFYRLTTAFFARPSDAWTW
ncbi:MAG: RICIN domain-containing protein [Deltaproteobacteria bacterium]|nr:RICIN domain-containing protein [Deltaproteobacteria bacterium]